MKYRPNYISVGLFAPRGAVPSWRTKQPAAASAAASAMENEGGLVPKDPATTDGAAS